MDLIINKNTFLVFDLDDTLYKEIDFLKSAYRHIAFLLEEDLDDYIYEEMIELYEEGASTFDVIKEKYDFEMSVKEMVHEYRYHLPTISLNRETELLLEELKSKEVMMGVITDGRGESQRNKLHALGILDLFEDLIISGEFGSEKPDEANFKYYNNKYPNKSFTYIGDNFKKDFLSPNKLAWRTIGILDDGQNIHKQDLGLSAEFLPQHTIKDFSELSLKFSNS